METEPGDTFALSFGGKAASYRIRWATVDMMSEKMTRWFPWALLVICAVTYAGQMNNDFMVDDPAFFRGGNFDSNFQKPADFLGGEGTRHFFPLYLYLNVTKHRLFPDFPPAHHLINLTLFFIACWLLYLVVHWLTGDLWPSILTAVFFCIHPVNADNLSHTDITNSLLAAVMMTSTFLCLSVYIRSRSKPLLYWLGVFFYFVAVGCGEPALLFPLYVFLFLFVGVKQDLKVSLKWAAPFFLIALSAFIFWMHFYGPSGQLLKGFRMLDVNAVEYVASVFYSIFWYIRNICYPGPIFLIHNFLPVQGNQAVLWFLLMVAVALQLVWLVKRWGRDRKTFALLWFFTGFIFVFPASLAHPAMGFVLEPYWLFFPTMGGMFLVALLLTELQPKVGPRVYVIFLSVILALWFVRTQEKHFIADNEPLYAYHWLKACPGNLVAGLILSSYYEEEDVDIDPELIPEMTRLIEIFYRTGTYDRAEKLNDKLIKTMHKLGASPANQ